MSSLNTEEFKDNETILYDSGMVHICHYISKFIECTAPTVNAL